MLFRSVKVTEVTCQVVFSIWDDEIEVTDVPGIIERAVEKAGYSLTSGPEIITTTVNYQEV